jgi:hypothetical protein
VPKTRNQFCINFLKGCDTDDCGIVALDSGCAFWIYPNERSTLGRPVWLRTTIPKSDAYYTLAFFFFDVLGCCQTDLEPLDTKETLMRVMQPGIPFPGLS